MNAKVWVCVHLDEPNTEVFVDLRVRKRSKHAGSPPPQAEAQQRKYGETYEDGDTDTNTETKHAETTAGCEGWVA